MKLNNALCCSECETLYPYELYREGAEGQKIRVHGCPDCGCKDAWNVSKRFGEKSPVSKYESILLQTMKALALPENLDCIDNLPRIAKSVFKDYVRLIKERQESILKIRGDVNL